MDLMREGNAFNKPPLLEGGVNYGVWKIRMRSFIKQQNEHAWKTVMYGWEAPTTMDNEGELILLPEDRWSAEEDRKSSANSTAINLIFAGVTLSVFRYISHCETAKEAWDILQVTFEGTTKVKAFKLQQLTTQFENLRMEEDENIEQFNGRICHIAHQAGTLGEKYSDAKLVKKTLRSLPERFEIKVTAIEESTDLDNLKLEELIGNLSTHELKFFKHKRPEKGIAFQAKKSESNACDKMSDEEQLAFFAKKVYKKFYKKKEDDTGSSKNFQKKDNQFKTESRFNNNSTGKWNSKEKDNKEYKPKEIQCRECRGFGHIQAECANTLKRNKNAYITTHSDSDSESNSDEEDGSNFVNFMGIITEKEPTYESDCEQVSTPVTTACETYSSDEEEPSDENITKQYLVLYEKYKCLSKQSLIISKLNVDLKDEVKSLTEKLKLQLAELTETKKIIKLLNVSASDKLDDMLSYSRGSKDISGLGYYGGKSTGKTTFIEAVAKAKTHDFDHKVRSSVATRVATRNKTQVYVKKVGSSVTTKVATMNKLNSFRDKNNFRLKLCNFCKKPGHSEIQCYLKRNRKYISQNTWLASVNKNLKWVWKVKEKATLVANNKAVINSLNAVTSNDWYFDSGCSKHMTGTASLLKNVTILTGNTVVFGGGDTGKIIGKGTLNKPGMPDIEDVFLVDGLKANLISISQLCDNEMTVKFDKERCLITNLNNDLIMTGVRSTNSCYVFEKAEKELPQSRCNQAITNNVDIWHKRLGHVNYKTLDKLVKKELIRGIPKLSAKTQSVCGDCAIGKQTKSIHKSTSLIYTKRVLELLHIDLMGPMQTASIGGKKYILVVVDDFSRYSWVVFLKDKSETFELFKTLCLKLQVEKGSTSGNIARIRSDHGTEFENIRFKEFCNSLGICHEFSAPKTPQQNGIVERKNRTIQEMARVMLNSKKLANRFWAEAVNTACHIVNRVYITKGTSMTAYEIWKGRKPNVKYFQVFGCVCYILRDREHLGKFDSKSDKGIFLGYAQNSRAFRVFNQRTNCVMESYNVLFDDLKTVDEITGDDEQAETTEKEKEETQQTGSPRVVGSPVATEVTTEVGTEVGTTVETQNAAESEEEEESSHAQSTSRPRYVRTQKNHSLDNVIGEVTSGMKTRGKRNNVVHFACYISQLEPKNIKEALEDSEWILAMQDELAQFERNDVWTLVPRPSNKNVIGTKWIFRNKSDEDGVIIRNKARLVAQGYTQIEGIDFDETFAPVARIESIRMLLSLACLYDFKLFQLDIKSAFLNGVINEEVYVCQPKGFEDPNFPEHVYLLKKALYGLKQAPRAWYDRLTKYLIEKGFNRGGVDKTLFTKKTTKDIIIAQIYVDDIVFGSTSDNRIAEFISDMKNEFEMSGGGELTYFLGLQVKQNEKGIFLCQSKYADNLVKKFGLSESKEKRTPMSTTLKLSKNDKGKSVCPSLYRSMIGSLLYLTASRPDLCLSVGVCARYQANPLEPHLLAVKRILRYVKGTPHLGLWYSKDTNHFLSGYCDADWAGNIDDRKSTSGGCFYFGNNLVSWFSKKQNCISLSTAEAEYVAAGSGCTQLIWMKQMLTDYNVKQEILTLFCDNKSAIDLAKNPVQHSRTKHIDLRHHFIRELVEEKSLILEHVSTERQLADIFTKPLDTNKFESLRSDIGVCHYQSN